jgi:toxin YhaV
MQRHGWTLLFHDCVIEQLRKLHAAVLRAQENDLEGFESNANVKLFRALGEAHRHWRRAKIGRRFRLFFRYDSKAKVIVYAWVNDEQTLRSAGSKSDPYAVFEKMLGRGNPPDDWNALVQASKQDWSKLE